MPHTALTACSALDRAVLNMCCLKQHVVQQEPNWCMLKKSKWEKCCPPASAGGGSITEEEPFGGLVRAGHLQLKQDRPGLHPGTVVMVWVSSISQVCACILRADPRPAGNAPSCAVLLQSSIALHPVD